MKRKINWLIAVCMSAAMVVGTGVCSVSAEEEPAGVADYKILFKDDFEDETKYSGNWTNTKNTDFAYSEAYYDGKTYGEYLKGNFTDYDYNYNHDRQQDGNTRSYYTMPNMTYRKQGSYNVSRAILMKVDPEKTDWYVDVKLAGRNSEYAEMAVGTLAEKAIDTSLLFFFNNGVGKGSTRGEFMSDARATSPAKLQLVYKVNDIEKTYDLGEQVIYTSKGAFNNGLHIRNTLRGILQDNEAYETATDIRVRLTGKVEDGLKELGFDNFLIKEVDPKEVFSEDFDDAPWFGCITSTNYLTKADTVDTIDGIDMSERGKAFRMVAQTADGFNHTIEFPIQNADPTKCYKVSFELYYPKSNATETKAIAWVFDKVSGSQSNSFVELSKNDDFEKCEAVFDFSQTPANKSNSKNLRLLIKFGDGAQQPGDVLYIDNISVREISVQSISAVQGNNWFNDKNTLKNGDVKFSFRNTDDECKGIVAQYKADGSLKDVSVVDVNTSKAADKTVSVTDDVAKVTAFMWNLDEVSSIIPAKVLTKAQ